MRRPEIDVRSRSSNRTAAPPQPNESNQAIAKEKEFRERANAILQSAETDDSITAILHDWFRLSPLVFHEVLKQGLTKHLINGGLQVLHEQQSSSSCIFLRVATPNIATPALINQVNIFVNAFEDLCGSSPNREEQDLNEEQILNDLPEILDIFDPLLTYIGENAERLFGNEMLLRLNIILDCVTKQNTRRSELEIALQISYLAKYILNYFLYPLILKKIEKLAEKNQFSETYKKNLVTMLASTLDAIEITDHPELYKYLQSAPTFDEIARYKLISLSYYRCYAQFVSECVKGSPLTDDQIFMIRMPLHRDAVFCQGVVDKALQTEELNSRTKLERLQLEIAKFPVDFFSMLLTILLEQLQKRGHNKAVEYGKKIDLKDANGFAKARTDFCGALLLVQDQDSVFFPELCDALQISVNDLFSSLFAFQRKAPIEASAPTPMKSAICILLRAEIKAFVKMMAESYLRSNNNNLSKLNDAKKNADLEFIKPFFDEFLNWMHSQGVEKLFNNEVRLKLQLLLDDLLPFGPENNPVNILRDDVLNRVIYPLVVEEIESYPVTNKLPELFKKNLISMCDTMFHLKLPREERDYNFFFFSASFDSTVKNKLILLSSFREFVHRLYEITQRSDYDRKTRIGLIQESTLCMTKLPLFTNTRSIVTHISLVLANNLIKQNERDELKALKQDIEKFNQTLFSVFLTILLENLEIKGHTRAIKLCNDLISAKPDKFEESRNDFHIEMLSVQSIDPTFLPSLAEKLGIEETQIIPALLDYAPVTEANAEEKNSKNNSRRGSRELPLSRTSRNTAGLLVGRFKKSEKSNPTTDYLPPGKDGPN